MTNSLSNKQKRGKELDELLAEKLKSWRNTIVESGGAFRYSQLQFSIVAGVSRETIRKRQIYLDEVLRSFDCSRKVLTKEISQARCQEEIDNLKSKLVDLNGKYNALRFQYLNILQKLHRFGYDKIVFSVDDVEGKVINTSREI